MSINKLELSGLEVDSFFLCAIHSSLPSYKMAFLLNKYIGLQFKRAYKDIEVINDGNLEVYPCYIFEDEKNYTEYSLIKNKCFFDKKVIEEKGNLFANESTEYRVKNLIPEFNKVYYFLKIETDNFMYSVKLLVSKITKINQVIASFEVDYEKIISKSNLIIE